MAQRLKQKDGKGDEQEGEEEQDKDKSDNPSLMQRASNVLSSAQQKATGAVSGVTSTVMSTAQSVPVIGTLLSKVGLGAAKSDDPADDKVEDDSGDKSEKSDDNSAADDNQSQQSKQGQGQADGDNDARSKVGGAKEASTEATTGGWQRAVDKGGGHIDTR